MKNYHRTLITENEKERILSLHMSNGYKTNNPLLLEKVQWNQNNTAPYKFLDSGENIKSLQKALGFPQRLQTGNFYTKTEAAVKNKMRELNLGEYSRNNGVTQDTFDKIVASPSSQLSTTQLQQLQSTANATTTNTSSTNTAGVNKQTGQSYQGADQSETNAFNTMYMRIEPDGVSPSEHGSLSFKLGFNNGANVDAGQGMISGQHTLTAVISDGAQNYQKTFTIDGQLTHKTFDIIFDETTPVLSGLTSDKQWTLSVYVGEKGPRFSEKIPLNQPAQATNQTTTQGPSTPGTKQGQREVDANGDTYVWDQPNQKWVSDKEYLALYNTDGTPKNKSVTPSQSDLAVNAELP